ncbi:MAG: hypothetical protein WCX97_02510 [Candidatus Magasanikbacteria bacterium]
MQDAVIKTLIYFDLFDYPLTKEELFKFCWKFRIEDKEKLNACLISLVDNGKIIFKNSFFFLPGRENLIAIRQRLVVYSELKLRRARLAAKLICHVPFLRAIFVCNSVSAEQAKSDSDIDFFIITAPNRVWLVRFFTNIILRLFGLRTYGQKRANRVCLSFYLDEAHLDFLPWRLLPDDIYLAYWLCQLLPIYNTDDYYRKIWAANSWARDLVPNVKLDDYLFMVENGRIGKWWKNLWQKMWAGDYGDLLEKQAKILQWQRLKSSLKDAAACADSAVIIKDGTIKLHENDRREAYQQKWLTRIKSFGG